MKSDPPQIAETQNDPPILTKATLSLRRDEPGSAMGYTFVYHGSETRHLDKPNATRSRSYWTFTVTDQAGQSTDLEYSEGYPGGMGQKPRFKAGYRQYVQLDWKTSTESEIELLLSPVEVGPSAGQPTAIALDTLYEFPRASVTVHLEETRAAYTPADIEKLLKDVPKEQISMSREMFGKAQVKTLRINVGVRGAASKTYTVEDNRLFQAYDVTEQEGPTRVTLQHHATIPGQLMLTLSP